MKRKKEILNLLHPDPVEILLDCLGRAFPHVNLYRALPVSSTFTCEIVSAGPYANESLQQMLDRLIGFFRQHPETEAEGAATELLREDEERTVLWALAQHLKLITLLNVPNSLAVSPIPAGTLLSDYFEICTAYRECLFRRACGIAGTILRCDMPALT